MKRSDRAFMKRRRSRPARAGRWQPEWAVAPAASERACVSATLLFTDSPSASGTVPWLESADVADPMVQL